MWIVLSVKFKFNQNTIFFIHQHASENTVYRMAVILSRPQCVDVHWDMAHILYHIAKTPLLHMLYYMNWLTHDFWTRPGGWEFDRSHGVGTSSPSHWQQVEEQAPKPVGRMMCFLLMTLGRIYTYNRSVIQYWWSCTPSHSIGLYFWGVHGSWVECHFLFYMVYQLCLALWWW